MAVDLRNGSGRRAAGLLLLAAFGVRGVLARRQASRAGELPVVELPGRPRLVEVLGGTLVHGEQPVVPERVLRPGLQVVGRSREADIRLTEETVSPRHAAVEADLEGRVVVRDLGALNGLSVDGVPVREAELHDGNRLQLGDAVLVYRVDPAADDGGRQGGELGEQEPLPET